MIKSSDPKQPVRFDRSLGPFKVIGPDRHAAYPHLIASTSQERMPGSPGKRQKEGQEDQGSLKKSYIILRLDFPVTSGGVEGSRSDMKATSLTFVC